MTWGQVRFVVEVGEKRYQTQIIAVESFQARPIHERQWPFPDSVSDLCECSIDDLLRDAAGDDAVIEAGDVWEFGGDLHIEDTSSWTDCGYEHDYEVHLENSYAKKMSEEHAKFLTEIESDHGRYADALHVEGNKGGSYLSIAAERDRESGIVRLEVGSGCVRHDPINAKVTSIAEILYEHWDEIEQEPGKPVSDQPGLFDDVKEKLSKIKGTL